MVLSHGWVPTDLAEITAQAGRPVLPLSICRPLGCVEGHHRRCWPHRVGRQGQAGADTNEGWVAVAGKRLKCVRFDMPFGGIFLANRHCSRLLKLEETEPHKFCATTAGHSTCKPPMLTIDFAGDTSLGF